MMPSNPSLWRRWRHRSRAYQPPALWSRLVAGGILLVGFPVIIPTAVWLWLLGNKPHPLKVMRPIFWIVAAVAACWMSVVAAWTGVFGEKRRPE